MPQIRPITDLRNTSEISDACHARREPVFITKNGYGDLVVMSIETYEEMLDCIATDKAIADADRRRRSASGRERGAWRAAEEVFWISTA